MGYARPVQRTAVLMYALLTQVDWDNIKDILSGTATLIVALAIMFFIYKRSR